MNAIFFVFCAISLIFCLLYSPDKALTAMIEGANKSLILTFTLASVYCVWMGVYKILDKANITDFIAKLLKKPVNFLFKNKDEEVSKLICLNIASNALGLGGVATPLGISACKKLQENNNFTGANLLVIISATSVQLLPTSVISLISLHGGKNPENIILPSLLCTAFSTFCGVTLFLLKEKFKRRFYLRQVKRKRRFGYGG